MRWNWQSPDWPTFRYAADRLAGRESRFLRQAGVVVGTVRHLSESERSELVIEVMSAEALKTSAIEGELLDRASVQSSLRRQFGLQTDGRRVGPAERGIAELLADEYRGFAEPLTAALLFRWHGQLMQGRTDLAHVGSWRRHAEPMQIVSGRIDAPEVHFEAPPSTLVATEMARLIAWFEATGPRSAAPLPALARAGIAHLHFESIHPFEDGNGRIGRALAEKSLAQSVGQPTLTALSLAIERVRKRYYDELAAASRGLDIDRWLAWFADVVLDAQAATLDWLDFVLAKTRLLDTLRGRLNPRQEKALLRVMREGPGGFVGGLSAGKYSSITGAPPATARRDLAELVSLGALRRTGERKTTRYWLTVATNASTATSLHGASTDGDEGASDAPENDAGA